MKIKEAIRITGGLARPSKMPCPSWSIPTDRCHLGSLYSTYQNSVCASCYAKKGHARFPVVKNKREERFQRWLTEPDWIEAMVTLIQRHAYFRFFESGDIYNDKMFLDICEVARKCPNTKFWLPTLERSIVLRNRTRIPDNLTIRFSSPFINKISHSSYFPVSAVFDNPPLDKTCHATVGDKKCGVCRWCWMKSKPIVFYKKH